jgi:hypothetical protein
VVVVVVVRGVDTCAGKGTRGVPRLSGKPDKGDDGKGLLVVVAVRGVGVGVGVGVGEGEGVEGATRTSGEPDERDDGKGLLLGVDDVVEVDGAGKRWPIPIIRYLILSQSRQRLSPPGPWQGPPLWPALRCGQAMIILQNSSVYFVINKPTIRPDHGKDRSVAMIVTRKARMHLRRRHSGPSVRNSFNVQDAEEGEI